MILDYAENIVQLLANVVALLLCLFQYISNRNKDWVYATALFLCSLLSCYYWTAYLVIMGDTPNVSNLFSYMGWNIAFLVLLLLVLHVRRPEDRRFFHPLMLLPVPLNLWQLSLYLPFGGVINSVYQVAVLTAVACFCLQAICRYWKNRKDGAPRPYVAVAALLYVLSEFGMWTTTCFDAPIADLYYHFSFLSSASFLLLVWALVQANKSRQDEAASRIDAKYQTILKIAYFSVVVVCCIGGILLGAWMRDTMASGLGQTSDSNVYDIIPVVLFVISLFLVAFAVAIVFVVTFSEKVAENNRLREARQIAEHSNAAKSEFLANMSHEIRTPINAVLGMNEMILRESHQALDRLPAESADMRRVFDDIGDYAGNIESAGNNLLSIINDILDVSKIEAGRMDIAEADYKLSTLLNDACNMIAFKARDKGLDFIVDVDAGLPDGLYGDEVRVRQVIVNVLNNAVKYTRAGSVRMTVRGEAPAQAGETIRLVIAVKDTGIGIRQADIDRLFQKFERVDLQQNNTVEGTGLGLAISRHLLDMMGGRIDVQSIYGEGSTFTIVLPQRVVSAEPVGDFRHRFRHGLQDEPKYGESFRAPEARILAVDDTRINLTVLVNLLKKTEMSIDTAGSGEEAIALCRDTRYDLILMDQRMPNMDGTEAMRRIREQPDGANRQTPFICLTADAVSGARERYLAEGFADYLAKPIDSRALERMLMNRLPVEKVQAQTGAAASPGTDGPAGFATEVLEAAGIDAQSGLRCCAGDADIYRMLLWEYVQGSAEKARDLRRYLDAEDWKNYGALAHALKSASRMIGADGLSEIAANQERAADAADRAAVVEGHPRMMARYDETVEVLRRIVPPADEPQPDDEILEFFPE